MINLDKLSEYLKTSDANVITLSFSEIENILGSELPAEAKQIAKWWWNIKNSKKARSWLDYGYYTYDNKNMLSIGKICFVRIEKKPKLQRGFSRIWYFLTDKDAGLHQKATALLEILVMPLIAILALIVAISSLYTTIFPPKSQYQIEQGFVNIVSEGDYALGNNEFLEAADYYNQASLIAYDTHSEAYSLHRKGMCYMLYGMAENDKNYLKKALIIFENIENTPKYENTQGYQEAVIDLCALYYYLDYDWEDEKWYSNVAQLETTYNFDDLENISAKDMATLISVATNLSLYYKTVLSNDIQFLDEDYQQKIIYYLKAITQLEIEYNEYFGVNIYDEGLLFAIYNMTHYMIVNAFFNPKDDTLEILEEARTMCQNAILTIDLDASNMSQLDLYIALKKNIGKSYYFSSIASDSPNKKKDYMLKAYQELIFLFYWDDYEISKSIIDTSQYILFTNLCTENDIQLILDRFSTYLQIAQKNSDIPTQIEMDLAGLRICSSILSYYEYETSNLNAQELGQQLWTDLNTVLFDFLDNDQKTELQKYSEKFGTSIYDIQQ